MSHSHQILSDSPHTPLDSFDLTHDIGQFCFYGHVNSEIKGCCPLQNDPCTIIGEVRPPLLQIVLDLTRMQALYYEASAHLPHFLYLTFIGTVCPHICCHLQRKVVHLRFAFTKAILTWSQNTVFKTSFTCALLCFYVDISQFPRYLLSIFF